MKPIRRLPAVLFAAAFACAMGQAAASPQVKPELREAASPLKGRMHREGRMLKSPNRESLLPAIQKDLAEALRLYDREVKRGAPSPKLKGRMSVGPDLASKGIIIVGGKSGHKLNKRMRPGRMTPRGGRIRPGPDLSARGIIIINGRPHALGRLQRAVHKFERALGLNHPQVRACRSQESMCMRKCNANLRQQKISGQCSCIGVRAHCLNDRFTLDPAPGEVRFGDGKHGRRLPAGK